MVNRKSMAALMMMPLVVAALTLGLAGSANAGNAAYCNSGQHCYYINANWEVGLGSRTPPTSGSTLVNVSLANNDRMSSWENRSSRDGRWYKETNGGGSTFCVGAFSERASLSFFDNDTMSSFRLYSSGAVC